MDVVRNAVEPEDGLMVLHRLRIAHGVIARVTAFVSAVTAREKFKSKSK